ncbi:MAG: response regulator, partial [Nitrospinaceae bacterium]|nr:response regulator [Nitrospinaceae bacterium]
MLEPDIRMLVVEDQGELRRALVAILKRMGASVVHSVSSGEDALEILAKSPVDFILCEYTLPELNGMALLREIRTNNAYAETPFIMLTNQGQFDDEEYAEAADYDIDGHLIKPLNQKDLEDIVDEILKKRAEFKECAIRLARAAAFVDIGADTEAATEIASAQEAQPTSTRVWVESGQLFEELGDNEKAHKSYARASKIDSFCAKAYEGMANILGKEGKSEEAFEFLKKAVDLSPKNKDRQLKMTRHLLESGDEDGARVSLHKALERESDPAARSAAAADFLMESGRADLAEAEYSFALESDPDNTRYYNRLGLAFRRQKKFREAIENYKKALTVSPDDTVLYYNMAVAL